MKRISLDYQAAKPGVCKICGNRIFPGMFIFDVQLQKGKRAVVHALCETKLKEVKKNDRSTRSQKRTLARPC